MSQEHRFTTDELDGLAELVAEKVAAKMQFQFSAEDAATLRGWCGAAREARMWSLRTFIGVVVVASLSAIGTGFVVWVRSQMAGGKP